MYSISQWHCLKTWPRTWTLEKTDPQKPDLFGKTGNEKLKMKPFVTSFMKDNVVHYCAKVIHFHIKRWGVQDIVLVQIPFWKVYHNFLFWKRQSWYKSINCQFVVLFSMERFCMFTHFYAASFSIFLISITRLIFTKLLGVSENSIKVNFSSH